MPKIVILGAGTAGTMMANRLCESLRPEIENNECSITVVDKNREHVYQPGLLFIPFGVYKARHDLAPQEGAWETTEKRKSMTVFPRQDTRSVSFSKKRNKKAVMESYDFLASSFSKRRSEFVSCPIPVCPQSKTYKQF